MAGQLACSKTTGAQLPDMQQVLCVLCSPHSVRAHLIPCSVATAAICGACMILLSLLLVGVRAALGEGAVALGVPNDKRPVLGGGVRCTGWLVERGRCTSPLRLSCRAFSVGLLWPLLLLLLRRCKAWSSGICGVCQQAQWGQEAAERFAPVTARAALRQCPRPRHSPGK